MEILKKDGASHRCITCKKKTIGVSIYCSISCIPRPAVDELAKLGYGKVIQGKFHNPYRRIAEMTEEIYQGTRNLNLI